LCHKFWWLINQLLLANMRFNLKFTKKQRATSNFLFICIFTLIYTYPPSWHLANMRFNLKFTKKTKRFKLKLFIYMYFYFNWYFQICKYKRVTKCKQSTFIKNYKMDFCSKWTCVANQNKVFSNAIGTSICT